MDVSIDDIYDLYKRISTAGLCEDFPALESVAFVPPSVPSGAPAHVRVTFTVSAPGWRAQQAKIKKMFGMKNIVYKPPARGLLN